MDDVGRGAGPARGRAGFSGVVRIDEGDRVVFAQAYGAAHRGWGIANQLDTRFGLASGAKTLTALTVMSLIEDGRLDRSTTARSVLGPDLPLIDDGVTVEHLLAHRSGIGDYLDEDDPRPDHRPPAGGAGPPAGRDRGLPGRARRVPDRVRARRAVRLLQRRLRRAGADRRTRGGNAVPPARRRAGLPAGGHGRHRLPEVGRAARWCGPRLPLRHGRADEPAPPARARQRRRRRLLHRGRRALVLAGAVRRSHRVAGGRRGDDRAPQRRSRRIIGATDSASGCTRPARP